MSAGGAAVPVVHGGLPAVLEARDQERSPSVTPEAVVEAEALARPPPILVPLRATV